MDYSGLNPFCLNINQDYFNIIDEKYVDLAVSIYIYRNNFIKKLNEYIGDKYYSISGDNGLVIKYISDYYNDNKKIIAASLILIEKLNMFKYAYAPKGFLIDYNDEQIVEEFTKHIKDYLNKKKEFEFYVLNISKGNSEYQEIIDVFKEAYPGLNPTKIYSVNNGYLLIAPKTTPDFNDPQYFVSSDLRKVTKFGIQNSCT